MSGPKYSQAELERNRLEMIKRQLEEEIEAVRCAELSKTISHQLETINSEIEKMELRHIKDIIHESEVEIGSNERIHELKELVVVAESLRCGEPNLNGNSNSLLAIRDEYENRLKKIKQVSSKIKSLKHELNDEFNETRQSNREEAFQEKHFEKRRFHSSVSKGVSDKLEEILDAVSSSSDYEDEKIKYEKIAYNHELDDAYKISQMDLLYQSYMIEQQYVRKANVSAEVEVEYRTLCELLFGECKEIPTDSIRVSNEIEVMRKSLEEKRCGEYIAQSLRSIMSELGYNITADEVLTEQKMQKQMFDYTPNSVVTVASSETGAVMLEVVGKKNPNEKDNNKTVVRMDMEKFCPDYDRIKEGLKAYSIILTDKKLCSPDEKYVRFVDTSNVGNRRVSTGSKKQRYMDD